MTTGRINQIACFRAAREPPRSAQAHRPASAGPAAPITRRGGVGAARAAALRRAGPCGPGAHSAARRDGDRPGAPTVHSAKQRSELCRPLRGSARAEPRGHERSVLPGRWGGRRGRLAQARRGDPTPFPHAPWCDFRCLAAVRRDGRWAPSESAPGTPALGESPCAAGRRTCRRCAALGGCPVAPKCGGRSGGPEPRHLRRGDRRPRVSTRVRDIVVIRSVERRAVRSPKGDGTALMGGGPGSAGLTRGLRAARGTAIDPLGGGVDCEERGARDGVAVIGEGDAFGASRDSPTLAGARHCRPPRAPLGSLGTTLHIVQTASPTGPFRLAGPLRGGAAAPPRLG